MCKLRAMASGQHPVVFSASRYNALGTEPLRIAQSRPDYVESLADGLNIFFNPLARRPVKRSLFSRKDICIHWIDRVSGVYQCEVSHGFLLERNCLTFGGQSSWRPGRSGHVAQHIAAPWAEDALIAVGGESYTFVNHFLAHHNGWSILIAMDSIDRDWGWQAQRGLFRDLAEYINAARDSDLQPDIEGEYSFFPTKEEAFVHARQRLDTHTRSKQNGQSGHSP